MSKEADNRSQIFLDSFLTVKGSRAPRLLTSTKAESPPPPDMRISARSMTTITYCSGLPVAEAKRLERDLRSSFFCSSLMLALVLSFNRGIEYEAQMRANSLRPTAHSQ